MNQETNTYPHAEDLEIISSHLRVAVVRIDATTAKRWLEHNTHNRPLSRPSVAKYRRNMADGLWTPTGEAIQFNREGVLIDGQHRLAALADLPGRTLLIVVATGLSSMAQRRIDSGTKRTGGNVLSLKGITPAPFIASVARLSLLWEMDLLFRDQNTHSLTSGPEIERWVDNNADTVEFLVKNIGLIRQTSAVPSVAGAAAAAFHRIDPDDALEFFEVLNHRAASTPGHGAIFALDQKLWSLRTAQTKPPTRDVLALFIQAWNAWRVGRTITKLRLGRWSASTYPEPK